MDPSSGDKSTSAPQVSEVGMEDGVTINEDLSLTARERAVKGSLVKMTGGGVT